ncbi:hypothetical protein P7H25_19825 [Paenibacillus larvae]|nr:hypothetical protein [Paenibacillus larvae]MDT2257346.1 hypothetical protein [Paenibacillus larvae]
MLKPTAGKERIADLDYIRGFALIGILLVNMPLFSGAEYQTYTGADRVIRLIFDLFVQAKFYTIFSFLFGVGFYLFVSRALVKGYSLNLYKKRITGLLLIGLVHLIFFWKGDILAIYAVSFFGCPFFPEGTIRNTKLGVRPNRGIPHCFCHSSKPYGMDYAAIVG